MWIRATFSTALLLCLISTLAHSQVYAVTDLGSLSPTSINGWAQVVGNFNDHAFIWDRRNGTRDLGTLPGGAFSSAVEINDFGVVTGTADGVGTVINLDPLSSNIECSDLIQPFFWTQKSGMQGLGSFGSESWWPDSVFCLMSFSASGINDVGQIVGYSAEGGTFQWATLWTGANGMMGFGGSWPPTYAIGVNNRGQIVGQNSPHGNACIGHATLWKNPTNEQVASDNGTDLGTLGVSTNPDVDYSSAANAINDRGQAVGWSTTAPISAFVDSSSSPVHAVLWTESGVVQDLGTLPGDTSSVASKLNLFGQVIGSSGSTVYFYNRCFGVRYPSPFELTGRPFIWSKRNGMRDLNTLINSSSGWVLNSAADINVWGQIVGTGTLNGQPHGFLLTPRYPFRLQ
jgi:probable HAF family extracellular repeat protein